LPLSVVGDGKSTVRQLLERKQRQFPKQGRDTIIDIDDFRMTNMLRTRGMNRGSVPKHGERIELLANANLSTGGDAVDVTERMHPKWKKLCVRLTRDMGLRYCGVDLMVQSEDMSDWPADYVIIEINAAPGLDHYASMGKKQQQIVESMYAKVLLAMYER
jgi:D-alanine-D-alanine ligase-like ATP-grasp enzyme